MAKCIGSQAIASAIVLWLLAASAADAQIDLVGASPSPAEVVKVSASFTASGSSPQGQLSVSASIKPGWHIYSITQAPHGPVQTKIDVERSPSYRLAGSFRALVEPEKAKEPEAYPNLVLELHHGKVTWLAPVEFAVGTELQGLQIKGKIFAQACNKNTCLMPTEFPFTASIAGALTANVPTAGGNGQAGPPPAPQSESAPPLPGVAPTAENRLDRSQNDRPANEMVPAPGVSTAGNPLDKISLILALGLGFLGGVILNVMPCVLPVIGLKILSFIEQARHDRWQALTLNIWYSLGLLSVFLVLATLSVTIGFGWGQMFTHQGFSIALAAVVFTMGLSFLGIWEIPIPGFVGRGVVNELQQKEGATGAFAKGVLTTILATPCSAPFLGTALAWTVKQPPINTYAVFTMAGLGMASPYLVLGAFPELMRYLPKPGAWMETFKQLMGFVLMATVVFLLSFLKFAYVVPTVALLFGLWGACWWIGRTPPTSALSAQVRAWAEAAAFSAVVWVIAFPGINIFLPGQAGAPGGLAGYMESRFERAVEHSKVTLSKTIQQLVDAKKTVLVDFTADWCLSCKLFEHSVLESETIRKAIDDHGIVFLRADWTLGAPDVTEMLERLGSKQVPVIAVFGSGGFDHPIVLRGGYTQQQLLDAIQQSSPSKAVEMLERRGISKM